MHFLKRQRDHQITRDRNSMDIVSNYTMEDSGRYKI